jgi:hypothetical protein
MSYQQVVPRVFNRPYGQLVGRPYEPYEQVQTTTPARTVDIETCIRKALGQSCINWLYLTERGRKDREDLEQHIRIEINQAWLKYGEGMNERLAWKIAHNQIVKFLDKNAHKPKEESLTDKPKTEEGDELPTVATVLVQRDREGIGTHSFSESPEKSGTLQKGTDWLTGLEEHGGIPALERLVSTYHGVKRIVAEALLKTPDMGVCDLPGVPRATFSRVRQAVLREFEQVLRTPMLDILHQKQLAGRFIRFLKDRGLTVEEAKVLPADHQQRLRDDFHLSENKEDTE